MKLTKVYYCKILFDQSKKMDEFQVPADLDRIPGKIYFGKSFTNFMAD